LKVPRTREEIIEHFSVTKQIALTFISKLRTGHRFDLVENGDTYQVTKIRPPKRGRPFTIDLSKDVESDKDVFTIRASKFKGNHNGDN